MTVLRNVNATIEGVVDIQQNVLASAVNSSTTNLAAGNSYTFTGTAASTLGVNGIQVSLFADKNCTVKVEQSPEGTNWDLIDTYYYSTCCNFGVTVQAISSYFRVVVSTNNETTTIFRLQSVLCPIAEPFPRSLDYNGNLKIGTAIDVYGYSAENTMMGDQRMIEPVRLVGTSFDGTTIASSFWTTAAAGTAATIAQANAQILLTSGTSNAAAVTAFTVRRARYIGGSGMRYRAAVQVSAAVANNKRRWGIGYGVTMPTVTDGVWFQINGTECGIVTCKGTTEIKITSFNGHLGASYTCDTNAHTYEIYWTNSKVIFSIDGELLHTISASTSTWSATMNFHVFADSVNSDVIGASATLAMRSATIYRLGKLETQSQYYRVSGNAATHVLKLGAGTLHKIVFNNTTGTSLQIVDNVTGTTPIIGLITTATGAQGAWDYNVPFFTGLILITVGNGLDATIVYE